MPRAEGLGDEQGYSIRHAVLGQGVSGESERRAHRDLQVGVPDDSRHGYADAGKCLRRDALSK